MLNNSAVPLILTLRLDADSQKFFNKQRKAYFPPDRDFLDAHLTLFHQLPDDELTREKLVSIAESQSTFQLQVTGLMFLGSGVAYRLESELLKQLHSNLASRFADELIPQDKQPLRPHVTIQNKVSPEKARGLMNTLSAQFTPFTAHAIGLDLWVYLGGPWQHAFYYEFNKSV